MLFLPNQPRASLSQGPGSHMPAAPLQGLGAPGHGSQCAGGITEGSRGSSLPFL